MSFSLFVHYLTLICVACYLIFDYFLYIRMVKKISVLTEKINKLEAKNNEL